MDWNLFLLSLATVFISELGDKSQLAAIALSGSARAPWAVFLGTSAALLLATFVGVLLGQGTAQLLPSPQLVKSLAALGFALMAVRLLWPSQDLPDD